MNRYEEKRQRRIDRIKGRAERLHDEADATHDRACKMADVIPVGQPILVGHYTEGRDRRYRKKIGDTFDKAASLYKDAKRADERAHAAETNTAISSDDPDAVKKLREKLAGLERDQELYRAINRIVLPLTPRKGKPAKPGWEGLVVDRLLATGLLKKQETAAKLTEKDFAGRYGVPDYKLQNNGAEIRRVKARIEQLTRAAAAQDHAPVTVGDATVSEDREFNRVQVRFPGKPAEQIRKELKGAGFRWAPSEGAWQRQGGPGVWEHALRTVRRIYPDAEPAAPPTSAPAAPSMEEARELDVAISDGDDAEPDSGPVETCRECGCHGDCDLGAHQTCGVLDRLCSRCAGTTGIPEVDDAAPARSTARQLSFAF